MSNPNERLAENEPGRYYVDSQCIDCDVCRDIAPDNFTRDTKRKYSFVYKQPENDQEESLCREAMEACPVEAIGDDGWRYQNVIKVGEA
jgi:ferredoxin